MTHHAVAHSASHGTGDINLAAAIMALGIPPDPITPCTIINRDDGRSYCRFFLLPLSACGKYETMQMMHIWSHPGDVIAPGHPFPEISRFIRRRPAECSSPDEWIGFAHDYLREVGKSTAGLPTRLEQIPDHVAKFPEHVSSYLLAFIHCRALCVDLVRLARRQVMQSAGQAHSLIDSDLSVKQRNELLARLKG